MMTNRSTCSSTWRDGEPSRYAVTLTGRVRLLRSIAAELACNPWADGVEVAVAGFAVAEAEALIALNPDRIRSLSSLSVEIARLRSRVVTARATLEHEGHADTFAWRIADPDGEIWAPQVLLVADPDPSEREELRQLANALTAGGRCAVAIVATWPADEAAPNPVLVTADGTLQLRLLHAQIGAAAAGMSAAEIGVLAEFMRDARSNTYWPAPPPRLADVDVEDDASDSIDDPADAYRATESGRRQCRAHRTHRGPRGRGRRDRRRGEPGEG